MGNEWLMLIVGWCVGGNEWRGGLLWGREILPHSGSCSSRGSGEMVWYVTL